MEFVLGIIVIVVIVAAISGGGSSTGPTPTTWTQPAARKTPVRPSTYTSATPAHRVAHQREIERQRRADEAFFDGVVFGHYFMDPYGADDESEDEPAWNDGADDDYDDGMYH